MHDTANGSRALETPDPRWRFAALEREDDGQEALDPARLRAMLDQREAAALRYRALKRRLLRRR